MVNFERVLTPAAMRTFPHCDSEVVKRAEPWNIMRSLEEPPVAAD
jgi:hypothetical protein